MQERRGCIQIECKAAARLHAVEPKHTSAACVEVCIFCVPMCVCEIKLCVLQNSGSAKLCLDSICPEKID